MRLKLGLETRVARNMRHAGNKLDWHAHFQFQSQLASNSNWGRLMKVTSRVDHGDAANEHAKGDYE